MAKAVFCVAPTEFQAEVIVNEIKVAGVPDAEISVLLPDRASGGPQGWETPPGSSGSRSALGWLNGVEPLSVPGTGAFIASGPIFGAVTGAGTKGIAGALAGMGLPEIDARRYESKIRAGGILVSIRSDTADQFNRVMSIFDQAGALDIAITSETAVHPSPPEVRDEKWEKW